MSAGWRSALRLSLNMSLVPRRTMQCLSLRPTYSNPNNSFLLTFDPYLDGKRFKTKKTKKSKKETKLKTKELNDDAYDAAYDEDTDIDEDVIEALRPKTDHIDIEPLPSYFASKQFFLQGDFSSGESELVTRYISAFGGTVQSYMRQSVSMVITANNYWTEDFTEALQVNPRLKFVRPSWVFACCDKGRMGEEGRHRILE